MRPRGPGAAFLALLLGSPGLHSASVAEAQNREREMPSAETLVRQFDQIAFSNEFGGAYRLGRIVRWNGPIRVRIEGRNAEQYRDEVAATLADLSRLTGLSIELANWASYLDPPGVVIAFGPDATMRALDPEAPCMTLIYDRAYVIRRVRITILPDDPARRRHCILEEVTQALGLANDSGLIAHSIFNDASRQQVLAPWDTLMLRVLYDPRLRPGMRRSEALPIAGEIIRSLLANAGFGARPAMRQAGGRNAR